MDDCRRHAQTVLGLFFHQYLHYSQSEGFLGMLIAAPTSLDLCPVLTIVGGPLARGWMLRLSLVIAGFPLRLKWLSRKRQGNL